MRADDARTLPEFSGEEGVDADAKDRCDEQEKDGSEYARQWFDGFVVFLFSVAEEQEKGSFGSACLDDLGRGRMKAHDQMLLIQA
jgi:hypothetical protein